MQIPKKSKPVELEVILERRQWYDQTKGEFFSKLKALSLSGYQDELLIFFKDGHSRFLDSADHNCIRDPEESLISLVPVIPRNLRSGFDQLSSLGFICGKKKSRFLIDPLVIKEVEATPVKPYCLYGVDFGISDIGNSPGLSFRRANDSRRLCLTEVEIICLAVIYPWLAQYFVCAAGVKLTHETVPCLQFDEKGCPIIIPVGLAFCGMPPSLKKVITPTCAARSLGGT